MRNKMMVISAAMMLGVASASLAIAGPGAGQGAGQGGGQGGGEGRAAGQLREADADGDGRITKQEVSASRASAFDRLDTNRDGFLTMEDRQAAGQGGDGAKAKGQGRGMRGLDGDSDGKISRAEFVDRPFAGFDRLDANKDGVIDQTELGAARERRGQRRKSD